MVLGLGLAAEVLNVSTGSSILTSRLLSDAASEKNTLQSETTVSTFAALGNRTNVAADMLVNVNPDSSPN